jgi:hypothetical protein
MARYLAGISAGRFILWCYFIYWVVIVVRYFEPSLQIWLTSVALSAIIGFALYVNTTRSGASRVRLGWWPTFRLFLTPFCVSSFSALVKGKDYPRLFEAALAAAACIALAMSIWVARRASRCVGPQGSAMAGSDQVKPAA